MNTQTQEALKMAIEALDNACIKIEKWTKGGKWTAGKEASLKCKEALAQLAQDDEKRALEFENDHLKKELDAAMTMLNAQPAQEPVALLEELSNLEHQQWMKWAQSIIDSEPISEARKQRWDTMMVDYKDLPNNIQEYDREWARKVLAITHPAPSCQECENLKRDLEGYMDANKALINREWQGLTSEEIRSLDLDNDVISVIFQTEKLLKEKNHG